MCPHEARPSVFPRTAAGVAGSTSSRDRIPNTGSGTAPPADEPFVAGPSGRTPGVTDDSVPVSESPE